MKKLIWLTLLLAIPAYPAAKIVDSGIAANAAIQRSKTASGTAYRILANGADGVMGENAAITADRAVASDSNGQLVASVATANELGYLSGVSSALQTQLDAKQALDGDLTAIAALTGTDTIYYRCGASTWCPVVVSTGLNFSSGTLEASGTASPLTTKGDIYVFGSANDRLPIGTNGYQLVADSTQTLGVKWAAPASGSSITKDYNISSHGFSVGDILNCTSTTSCTKSKADSEANSEISGMVSSVADTDHFTLTQIGYVTGLPTMTADEVEFLSDVTAGAMQNTAPTDLNHVNCPVFKSDSTTSGYFHAQRCFTVPAVSSGGIGHWQNANSAISFTGLGTVTNKELFARCVGENLEVYGNFTDGTGLSGSTTVSLNLTGYTIKASVLPTKANSQPLGTMWQYNTAGSSYWDSSYVFWIFYDGSTTSKLYFSRNFGSALFMNAAVGNNFYEGTTVAIKFSVPVEECMQ